MHYDDFVIFNIGFVFYIFLLHLINFFPESLPRPTYLQLNERQFYMNKLYLASKYTHGVAATQKYEWLTSLLLIYAKLNTILLKLVGKTYLRNFDYVYIVYSYT